MKLFVIFIASIRVVGEKMINILIADDNLIFSKNLINNILSNQNVKICRLCTNGEEVLNTLIEEEIDVILLDIFMPICNGLEVLDKLSDSQREKYEKSIIVISAENKFIPKLIDNPLVFDYIIKGTETNKIIEKISKLVESKNVESKKNEIENELKKIGYNANYKGTLYLVNAILELYLNKDVYGDNLEKTIYPIIAKMFKKTPHNIKCNINNATESMYYNCNINILKDYFCFFDDKKPTTKTVIYTVLNKII